MMGIPEAIANDVHTRVIRLKKRADQLYCGFPEVIKTQHLHQLASALIEEAMLLFREESATSNEDELQSMRAALEELVNEALYSSSDDTCVPQEIDPAGSEGDEGSGDER